jgi:hypothetical protein
MLGFMNPSEQSSASEVPPVFDASPVVTIELFGQSFSISQAKAILKALGDHVDKLLHPAEGWYWWSLDGLPTDVLLLRPAARTRYLNDASGLVQRETDGLYHAYVRSVPGSLEACGITNELDDAKWMVAEAIRVLQLAEQEKAKSDALATRD